MRIRANPENPLCKPRSAERPTRWRSTARSPWSLVPVSSPYSVERRFVTWTARRPTVRLRIRRHFRTGPVRYHGHHVHSPDSPSLPKRSCCFNELFFRTTFKIEMRTFHFRMRQIAKIYNSLLKGKKTKINLRISSEKLWREKIIFYHSSFCFFGNSFFLFTLVLHNNKKKEKIR